MVPARDEWSHEEAYLQEGYRREQAYPQATNQGTKNDEETHHFVTESKQDVDRLVDTALQLTWDMCFDGTQVVFKEPETLTIFKVEPIRLQISSHTIWIRDDHNIKDEELSLDPAEATLVRAMKAGKSRILHCLKLRGPKSLEADKLFMKLSPNDFRLKREQDTEKLNKFKFYKHNLHAPKGSNDIFVCIPNHPWPEFSQPFTCLHCNLTTDNVTMDQFQLPSIDTSRPRTSEVRILHNQNLCRYHDYHHNSGRSLGYHELWALNAFHQGGISFGTGRESNPGRCRRQGLKKYLVGKSSHFRYFIHRMREEVLVERGHLVTTEADLKLGTFFEEGSVSEYVPDGYKGKRKAKRIGVIGDGRPVVGRD